MLTLDLPISTNYLYRRTRYTVVLTNDAMAYKQYAQIVAARQWNNEPLEGELCITYRFFGSRLDIDNGIKLLQDSLEGVCFYNDNQIVELHVYKYPNDGNKRVEIEVSKR